jgi:outer membrane protein, heavy metal efflux system
MLSAALYATAANARRRTHTSASPCARLQQIVFVLACILGVGHAGSTVTLAQGGEKLSLSSALQRALRANPRLAAAGFDVDAANGRRLQAGAIPNPELSFELDNALGSGEFRGLRSAETTLQVSQLFEFRGKRETRLAAGTAETDNASWQLEALRLEILGDTATAFINVVGAQRRLQLYDEHIAALGRLLPLLQRRVEAGASSPAETARAQVAADLVRADRERAKGALAIARLELVTLMGANAPANVQAIGNLSSIGRPPALRLVLQSIDRLPQLARWSAVRAQRDAELALARLKPYPDLRVGAAWRHFNDTDDNAVRLNFAVPLPVFDRNVGGIAEAQAARAKVDAEYATGKAALVLALGRAYETLTGSVREIDILRTAALPNARQAQQAMESGYAQGRFSLLELLDVQNTLTQAGLRELEALTNFHTSVATIEGLTGTPLGLTREKLR